MPRYFTPITLDEFKNKLYAQAKHEWDNPDDWIWRTCWPELNDTIIKDLSKIRFYPENWDVEAQYMPMTGLNTLPNGMPYLGVLAGGDGEAYVFSIIYWDGKKLRGYVPEDGNIFNPKRRAAWGDMETFEDIEDEEREAIRAMGYEISDDVVAAEFAEDYFVYDCDKITTDIMGRILPK